MLDLLAREPKSRALYLYPTKALAQDQARALSAFGVKGVKAAIYDGDTEGERRWQIRKWANVVLTNPDMLHVGVLPHHDRWGDVLANLRYVVVDEAHVYRGVFGSHVRERAPAPAAARQSVRLGAAVRARVGDDREPGAARGVPPRRAGARGRQRRGACHRADDRALEPGADRRGARRPSECARDASRLLAGFVAAGQRTICFAKSRKAVELIHRFASGRLDPALAARLAPYRAGYTPTQRCEIEQRLMAGELLGVTATDALELGIDIGSLHCSISVASPAPSRRYASNGAVPGGGCLGLAVLVASEDALDQYFMREPETLLARTVEAAILDHANPRVLDGHVLSAAFEGPIDERGRRDARPGGARARRRCCRS